MVYRLNSVAWRFPQRRLASTSHGSTSSEATLGGEKGGPLMSEIERLQHHEAGMCWFTIQFWTHSLVIVYWTSTPNTRYYSCYASINSSIIERKDSNCHFFRKCRILQIGKSTFRYWMFRCNFGYWNGSRLPRTRTSRKCWISLQRQT